MQARLPRLGAYRLLSRLGAGGTAEVYLATTTGPDGRERVVALKRILPEFADEPDFATMLIDEARLVSQLSHPGIAAVVDLGQEGHELYLAMEYVRGRDLASIAKKLKSRKARLEPELAAWIVAAMLDALDYAHHATGRDGKPLELVHRDVSPANCLVSDEGEVKLIDFGIARATNRITQTQAGVLKGKYRYMSPEQATGRPLDGRSDLYSAGVVLHELLVGEKLHEGDSELSLMKKIAAGKVPRLIDNPDIDPGLAAIVDRALEKDPARRWQRGRAFAGALRGWLRDVAPQRDLGHVLLVFMQTMFADELNAEQRQVDVAVEAARPRPPPPPADAFDDEETTTTETAPDKVASPVAPPPVAPPPAPATVSPFGERPVSLLGPAQAPSRSRWTTPVVVALVALAAVAVGARAVLIQPPQPPAPTPAELVTLPAVPVPVPEPAPEPVPVAVVEPVPVPAVVAAVAPPAPRPKTVKKVSKGLLSVSSDRPGRLWIDGEQTKHMAPVTAIDIELGPHVVWVEDAQGNRADARTNVREDVVTHVLVSFD